MTNNKMTEMSFTDKINSSKMTMLDQSLDGLKININLEIPTSARMFLA